ncbi:YraN family protein [Ghiorsea bivora]|uniref:YraN family protein n=1 Tax=Ghiorsea bivora TaxID=1485545 RepID=UPI00057094B8|nr:YraN family protein [Ghiorsea bivora]
MSTVKGKVAEDAAAKFLIKKGYVILDRNRRLGRGELDIVASSADILAFVEVKGHQQRTSSIEAMHQDKQQRMVSAAQTWLGQHPKFGNYQCRFDLIVVLPSNIKLLPPKIEHIKDIIRL